MVERTEVEPFDRIAGIEWNAVEIYRICCMARSLRSLRQVATRDCNTNTTIPILGGSIPIPILRKFVNTNTNTNTILANTNTESVNTNTF